MASRVRLHRPRWLRRDERRKDRVAVSIPAGVYGRNTDRAVVRVTDLCATGCHLKGVRPGGTGPYLTLEIAGMLSVEAWVAWTRADEVALDFVHPMPTPLIEQIVAVAALRR